MLLNKTIRFCDKFGTEHVGPVDKELDFTLEINKIQYFKHEIRILEVLPYRFYAIQWHRGWANDPELEIQMTREDYENTVSSFRYTKKQGYYWAEKDGIVSFYYYIQPGPGFGGRKFTLNMQDGSREVLSGPWSGNYFTANRIFTNQCMSCNIVVHDNGSRLNKWDLFSRRNKIRSLYAGHILVEKARMLLPPGIELYYNGDTICPSLDSERLVKQS